MRSDDQASQRWGRSARFRATVIGRARDKALGLSGPQGGARVTPPQTRCSGRAHAQGVEGIKNAIESGVRTIEHGVYVDEETADDMVRRATYLVPTFHAGQGFLKAEEANSGSFLPQSLRKAREARGILEVYIRMAIERGVKVAMGTDAGVGRHGTNAEELTYLVTMGGMSPMEAIVAATRTAAECNQMDSEVGTLTEGMFADLLVVDGDPLADISILEEKSNLLMIMQGGNPHKDLITG